MRIIKIIITLAIAIAIPLNKIISQEVMQVKSKKVNVWDTYVTRKDGVTMHFDIIAPVEIQDTSIIYQYGKTYLKSKGQEGQPLSSEQCRLCHVEYLRPSWEQEIHEKGYFIIEMEGCDL